MYDNAEELREQQAVVLNDHDHMSNSSEDRQTIITRTKTSSQHDWVLLAVAIDRVTFLIYCLIFTIFATVYSVWYSAHQMLQQPHTTRRTLNLETLNMVSCFACLVNALVTLCQTNLPRKNPRCLHCSTSAAYQSSLSHLHISLLTQQRCTQVLRYAIYRPLRAVAKSRKTRHNLDLTHTQTNLSNSNLYN